MSKFVRHCLLFGVVLFLLFSAMDFCCSKVAERSDRQPFNIWHDIMGGTVDADVVALGNSLVTLDFNTEYLDSTLGVKTYAMGFSGSQFDRQSYMYSLYRSRNRPPKVMVNFIDQRSMSLTKRVPDKEQFFPWFFDKDFRRVVFPVESFSLADRFIPMWRWREFNFNLFLSRLDSHITKGFKYVSYSLSPFPEASSKPMRFGSDIVALTPLWEEYLSRNASEGIRTVFVVPPMYNSYYYAPGCKELLDSTFQAFARRYGANFLDYSSLSIKEDSTCFRDPYHLNGKGSEVFCETLSRDLRNLVLMDKNP